MDAVKFMKEKKRMCDLYVNAIGCTCCPLSVYNNKTAEKCKHYIFNKPEEAVAAVEKWSSEHPIKTRQSEFLKMFPNASIGVNGAITICPCHIDAKFETEICGISKCEDCKKEYWLVEVENE